MLDHNQVPFPSAIHPRFNAGVVSITVAAQRVCSLPLLRLCLGRHVRSDYGVADARQVSANRQALQTAGVVRSAFAIDACRDCDADNTLLVVTNLAAGSTLFLLEVELAAPA
ncbi:MAG TPA: hypothetical protein VJV78_32395 [Polyangiales bacterium]|nr:hypothetical protein [Polyangiales bacterium]